MAHKSGFFHPPEMVLKPFNKLGFDALPFPQPASSSRDLFDNLNKMEITQVTPENVSQNNNRYFQKWDERTVN